MECRAVGYSLHVHTNSDSCAVPWLTFGVPWISSGLPSITTALQWRHSSRLVLSNATRSREQRSLTFRPQHVYFFSYCVTTAHNYPQCRMELRVSRSRVPPSLCCRLPSWAFSTDVRQIASLAEDIRVPFKLQRQRNTYNLQNPPTISNCCATWTRSIIEDARDQRLLRHSLPMNAISSMIAAERLLVAQAAPM